MLSARTLEALSVVENVERAVRLAKRLRCLNMFITETFDDAIAQAKKLSSHRPGERKALHGVTFGVKDCYSTKDVLTTCASRMLSNYKPPYTATVVQKAIDNGAIVLGKMNMDEFCMGASSTDSYYGAVKNSWSLNVFAQEEKSAGQTAEKQLENDWFLAGGSSGGSAAAVACGITRIALGSDTGGSTRNPAAFCGVVGLKPSYGLLSRHGLIPLVNSLDTPGILARNVDDAALALETLSGRDPLDSTTVDRPAKSFLHEDFPDVAGLKIGLPKEYNISNLSPEIVKWWRSIAGLLEQKGACHLSEVSLPHTEYSIICYHVLGECEIASNMARYDGIEFGFRADTDDNFNKLLASSRSASFNDVVRRRILAGNYFLLRENYQQFFLKALKVRRLIAEDFYRIFRSDSSSKVDILLAPATLSDAPLFSEWKGGLHEGYERERQDDYFTQPVNMAGVAAVTIPVALSKRGLPIGLQLIGDMLDERKLLRVAKFIEKHVEFPMLDGETLVKTH